MNDEQRMLDQIWEHDIFLAVLNIPCWRPFSWETLRWWGQKFNDLMLTNSAARRAYIYGQRWSEREKTA